MTTANLTIGMNMSHVSLILPGISLNEPAPEHPLLTDENTYFSYYGRVGVQSRTHWNGVTSSITTLPHTGRGQAKLFDKLVGSRIASLRLTLSREMRQLLEVNNFCDEQQLDVHLNDYEVDHLRETIEACADDESPTYFLWTAHGLGRYDENNRLVWGR
jgi:hypothetical protein